jgi:hypothetical protein
MGNAQAGPEQAAMVVDFRDRGQGATRPGRAVVLGDAQSGRQPIDEKGIGPLQLLKQRPAIVAQSFEVAALALGMKRIKGEGTFA